jgi:hypothetical protein
MGPFPPPLRGSGTWDSRHSGVASVPRAIGLERKYLGSWERHQEGDRTTIAAESSIAEPDPNVKVRAITLLECRTGLSNEGMEEEAGGVLHSGSAAISCSCQPGHLFVERSKYINLVGDQGQA